MTSRIMVGRQYDVEAPPHPPVRVTVARIVRDWWGEPSIYFAEPDGRPNVMSRSEFFRRATEVPEETP